MMKRQNVLILGAAGRDFHNFLVYFKDNTNYDVKAFTATQIIGIENRLFPKKMAGKKTIPIYSEKNLERLIKKFKIDVCVLAYSDLSLNQVRQIKKRCLKAKSDFLILGPEETQLKSCKKVISITAVRTGSGKSSLTKFIARILKKNNIKPIIVRHPMPYGNLLKQEVEVFRSTRDLKKYDLTLEEREEFEQEIEEGNIALEGVDYRKILKKAESLGEIIIWDGGNNDFSFFKPDLDIVIADPFRANQLLNAYPGTLNLKRAQIIVISKESTASKKQISKTKSIIKKINPNAIIIDSNLNIVSNKINLNDKKVLCVEDGPSVTHGGLKRGAAYYFAKKHNAIIVKPKKFMVGLIKKAFNDFPHLQDVIPCLGYNKQELKDLEKSINQTECDAVLIGTPIKLQKIIKINKPCFNINYEFKEKKSGSLEKIIKKFIHQKV